MGTRSRFRKRRLAALVGASALLTIPLAGPGQAAAPKVPTYTPPNRIVWLEQGWSPAVRQWYHHVPQGTATLPLPYTWFMALEQPNPALTARALFREPTYLDRFGFIPSPRDPVHNPDELPVGFARAKIIDPSDGRAVDQLGLTCAACHTGRFDYAGTRVLIDGAPAITELGKFRKALAEALAMTSLSPPRFKRFADRVLGPNHPVDQGLKLHNQVGRVLAGAVMARFKAPSTTGSVEEGFGRLDALNRIGNEVFGDQMGEKANIAALTAPVAYPHIWDTAWYDWVQYNSSIEQPMVRNAGEAMGVQALVNFNSTHTPRYTSTVPVGTLHAIEEALAGKDQPTARQRFTGLRSPAWPENILPRIDRTLAAQGRALYAENCASCHLPGPDGAEFWASNRWLPANRFGQRYLRPSVIPVDKIGTDPAQAVDMKNRKVRVPLAYGLTIPALATVGAKGIYPYGPALGDVVEKVVVRWYDSHVPPVPQPERDRINGFRPNGIRDGLPGPNGTVPVYKARPLNGVWATAPFLHNGGVPTLYDLLSPLNERPKSFWLGNRTFDPVKVGFVSSPIAGGFQLVSVDARGRTIRGNSNAGHLFESPATPAQRRPGTIGRFLSPDERKALVEYLKTL